MQNDFYTKPPAFHIDFFMLLRDLVVENQVLQYQPGIFLGLKSTLGFTSKLN